MIGFHIGNFELGNVCFFMPVRRESWQERDHCDPKQENYIP